MRKSFEIERNMEHIKSEALKSMSENEALFEESQIQSETFISESTQMKEVIRKYEELINLSETSYFILSNKGDILKYNIYSSQMLGTEDLDLNNTRLDFFITRDTIQIFNQFFKAIFESNCKQSCELKLIIQGSLTKYVLMFGIALKNCDQCYINALDITDHKQTENELIESKERYKRITESLTDYIYKVKVENGNVIETIHGNACITLTGYSSDDFSADPFLWINMVVPEDRELINENIFKIHSGEKQPPFEHRIIRKDGNICWVKHTLIPKYDSDGNLTYYDGVINDITERKEVVEALKYEQRVMNSLMSNIPDHIYFKDCDSRFIRINPGMAALLKISDPSMAIGKTDFDFFTKEHAQQAFDDEQRIIKTGKPVIKEEKETWPDRPDSWVSTTKLPLFGQDDKLLGTFGISVNITDRKLAEIKLQKDRILLKTMINSLPCAVFVKDKNYRKIIANEYHLACMSAHLKNLGIDPKTDIINKTDFEICPDKLAEKYLSDDQKVIENGEFIINKEEHGYSPEGKQIAVLISKVPLRDTDGNIEGMVGITTDITALKQTESKLKENEAILKKTNKDKDRFISIMAHDLRGPFFAILGFLDLLAENIHTYEIDEIESKVLLLKISAENTFNLLENLLKWENAQLNQYSFEPRRFFLGETTNKVIGHLELMAKTKKITINKNIPQDIEVLGDIEMFKIILRNLISNAIKFTHQEGTVSLYAEQDREFVTIVVSDNGVGIIPETLAKLFDISHITTTKGTLDESGTGLGLLLCNEFVEKNGGKIWVLSEVGKGTEFKFTMPKYDDHEKN